MERKRGERQSQGEWDWNKDKNMDRKREKEKEGDRENDNSTVRELSPAMILALIAIHCGVKQTHTHKTKTQMWFQYTRRKFVSLCQSIWCFGCHGTCLTYWIQAMQPSHYEKIWLWAGRCKYATMGKNFGRGPGNMLSRKVRLKTGVMGMTPNKWKRLLEDD